MAQKLIDLVYAKVKDDSGKLTDIDDYNPAIAAALERYSIHRPKAAVSDLVGNGTHDLPMPAGWVEEFSMVISVEWPVGEAPGSIVDNDTWRVYHTPDGEILRLALDVPDAGDPVRMTFTVMRTVDDIIAGDADAVACLAASIVLDDLATLYAATSDPTISADVVDYQGKSGRYAARAKILRQRYMTHMGVKDDQSPAALTVARPPDSDRPRITHGRYEVLPAWYRRQ